ncbi:MAG: hypothetical protein P9L94_17015 [Candidatus Hinthialibacter antarcticus]|nr:hypothetical protein [Candidatus Hinthialibacter antarcticus]
MARTRRGDFKRALSQGLSSLRAALPLPPTQFKLAIITFLLAFFLSSVYSEEVYEPFYYPVRDDFSTQYLDYARDINLRVYELRFIYDWSTREEQKTFFEDRIHEITNTLENRNFFRENEIIKLSALCYLALEKGDISPVGLLREHLMLSLNNNPYQFYGGFRNKFEKRPDRKLIDFPVLYLALHNGEPALPELRQIVYDESLPFRDRALAYLLIHQIKPLYRMSVYAEFRSGLAEEQQMYFDRLHWFLDIEPWKINDVFKPWHPRLLEQRKIRAMN